MCCRRMNHHCHRHSHHHHLFLLIILNLSLFRDDCTFINLPYITASTPHRGGEDDPLEVRVEELAHHIRVEKAVVDGSQKYIKMLQPNNSKDKNSLKEVRGQSLIHWYLWVHHLFIYFKRNYGYQNENSRSI